MAVMEDQCPEWAAANRPRVLAGLAWLDGRLSASRFVAGDRLTIADITAAVAVDFLRPTRIPVPERCEALRTWRAGPRAALAWQIELGADEAIGEAPVNRFER
jgi:glutathione S-transferase